VQDLDHQASAEQLESGILLPADSPGSSRHVPNLGRSSLVQEEMAPAFPVLPRGYPTPMFVERPLTAAAKEAKLQSGSTRFVVRILTDTDRHLTFA
jgi:hypothetical protein